MGVLWWEDSLQLLFSSKINKLCKKHMIYWVCMSERKIKEQANMIKIKNFKKWSVLTILMRMEISYSTKINNKVERKNKAYNNKMETWKTEHSHTLI